MPKYEQLSKEVEERIRADRVSGNYPHYAANGALAIRRNPLHDKETVWRGAYVRDADKIMYSPFYNRYTDKTQAFSFYKNDDITRRALHVQLVSRIARAIGSVLHLNLDLIEAIALGHDIGHTPFGHAGERYLSEVYRAETGRFFNHNVHSVRVLDGIFSHNITLDTLNGILAHNGEFEMSEYYPVPMTSFAEFDKTVENCYVDETNNYKIAPSTLEGCVVRVSDIIAYLGRDRQDAMRAHITTPDTFLDSSGLGTINAEIINNLEVNIIENSYGHPYIRLDEAHFRALSETKKENYREIYLNESLTTVLDGTVKPVMQKLYYKLLEDLKNGNKSSPIYTHHIDFVANHHYYDSPMPYLETEKNQIVVDYLASMTDDYCSELYAFLFPKSDIKIQYHGYFD